MTYGRGKYHLSGAECQPVRTDVSERADSGFRAVREFVKKIWQLIAETAPVLLERTVNASSAAKSLILRHKVVACADFRAGMRIDQRVRLACRFVASEHPRAMHTR